MPKHPLYTALGWLVWTMGKRQLRSRIAAASPARSTLRLTILSVGVSLAATFIVRKSLAQGPSTGQ